MRILSLDGGGYLGLATAAFVEEAERHFRTSCHDRFDLFCGTSTGAIIALALAAGKSGREVVELYRAFGATVFRNPFPGARFLRLLRGAATSLYSNGRLREALREAFGDLTLGDLRRSGKFVLIPAYNLSSGRPRVFKTNHSTELTLDDDYLVRDIALASAAAPIFLPIVSIPSPTNGVEERFCDGGLFANYPALLGYAEAVSYLKTAPEDIQILSLSTPRSSLAERASAQSWLDRVLLGRGLFAWGPRLTNVMVDATSTIMHSALRLIMEAHSATGAHYERIELQRPDGVALDIATRQATETLLQIGCEKARDTVVRRLIAPFFVSKEIHHGLHPEAV
jgi:patatin-like phospholipase/acyl hydrolase